MKSTSIQQPKSSNYQSESTREEEVMLTAQAISQMAQGQIPDLKNICQELYDTIIKHGGSTFNALQFVPALNEMMAIDRSEMDIFIKNPQTNQVLVENEFLKIVLINWLPGKISSIHGHPKGGGVFKVISGSIEELRYTSDTMPKLLSVSAYHKDAIGYIDDQLAYHAVGNPHIESAVSLHVYTRV